MTAGDIYEFITIADALHRLPNIDIPFWLMCGVVREDDVPGDPAGIDANIDGSFYRVLNHFYDPVNDKPLNGLLITPGAIALNGFAPVKAPDWATGAKDSFGSPNTLDPATRNNYTVFDAHEAMFRALTQQTQTGGGVIDLVDETTTLVYDASVLAPLQATRNAYLGNDFSCSGRCVAPQSGHGPASAHAQRTT